MNNQEYNNKCNTERPKAAIIGKLNQRSNVFTIDANAQGRVLLKMKLNDVDIVFVYSCHVNSSRISLRSLNFFSICFCSVKKTLLLALEFWDIFTVVRIVFYHSSVLSRLPFIIQLWVLPRNIRSECPEKLLYADDLALVSQLNVSHYCTERLKT